MKREIAEEISDLMLEYGAKLNKSLILMKEECEENEYVIYRDATSKLLAIMLIDVMNPIYKDHPGLKPKELD